MLVHIIRMAPQDVRARAACVCRTWRDAAADPALFAALWLDSSSDGKLSDVALSRLCKRAGAMLRELRLNAPACDAVSAAGVLAALRAGGCAGVQRLTLPKREWICDARSLSAAQAQQLAAACPVLEPECYFLCFSPDDVAAVCASLPGPLSLIVYGHLDAARATLQLPSQVAELAICRCALDTACVAAIRDALHTNTNLTSLSLLYNRIGEAGAAALGEALRTNITLTTLCLQGDNIGDAGITSISEALRTNVTLTALDLSYIQIRDAGAAALANVLRTNATLTTLTLKRTYNYSDYYNYSRDVEPALTDALSANTGRLMLTLGGCNHFSPAAAAELARSSRAHLLAVRASRTRNPSIHT